MSNISSVLLKAVMGAVIDSFTIDLSSDGSTLTNFAKENSHSDFRICFPRPLRLDSGKWSVALTKVQYPRYLLNVDQCSFTVWNGVYETVITLPSWHCSEVATLVTVINDKMKELTFESIHNRRMKTQASVERKIRNVPSQTIKKDDPEVNNSIPKIDAESSLLSKDDESPLPRKSDENLVPGKENPSLIKFPKFEFTPRRFLLRQIAQRMINQFTESKNPSFPWEAFSNTDTIFPPLTFTYNTVTPIGDPVYDDLSIKFKKEISSRIIENETMNSAVELFNIIIGEFIMSADPDMVEPQNYAPPVLQIDAISGRIFIQSNSPDFDICFSDNLRTKLGFTDDRFSVESYSRRRFFHSYLLYQSKNVTFLSGQGYLNLKNGEAVILDNEEDAVESGSYFTYINKVVNSLLKIPSEQVWIDFSFNDPKDPTDPNYKFILDRRSSNRWPERSRWGKYFPSRTFHKLSNLYEGVKIDEKIPRNTNYQSYKQLFREKGSAITYFMIKTLCDELPLKQQVFADSPPQLNFPYETFMVYTDIIQPQIFNETEFTLLEIFQADLESKTSVVIGWEPRNITYKPCLKGIVPHIRITVASTGGLRVPFMFGPVIVQLHFIQRAEP